MLSRVSAPLNALLARGVAVMADDGVIELFLERQEVEEGGMVTISMRVAVHCPHCATAVAAASCWRCDGARTIDDLFSAWLAVRPGVADGTILHPSAQLPSVVRPVTFRVRRA